MSTPQISRRDFVQAGAALAAGTALASPAPDPRKTRSYNEKMEYRRLGRTNLMLSVVSIGGHWKKIPYPRGTEDFMKNRREVMSACLDHGINYVDACSAGEVTVYAEALRGKREQIYFGFDWTLGRKPEIAGSLEKMKQGLDDGLKKTGLDYVDLWRVTMREQTTLNSEHEIETVIAALEWGKKTGKARFTGISTHNRVWLKSVIEQYPQTIQVVCTPYTASSKELPTDSLFAAVRKHDVGIFGIKPFADNALFKGDGTVRSAFREEDDKRARLALRYILGNPAITAPIPGLITMEQVENVAKAVAERRKLDPKEAAHLEKACGEMWANLRPSHEWLKNWEFV
jgi:predicted aldo/keto reductase-like oxidoreductase